MNKRQRICFRVGAWASVATSFIHMAGAFAGARQPPADATETELLKLMTTYHKDMGGGILRSTMDLLNGFSVSFALLFLWVGILCVVLVRRRAEDAVLMRPVTWTCAIFSGALLAVSVVDFFWPPTICVAVVFLGFAGAMMPPAGAPAR